MQDFQHAGRGRLFGLESLPAQRLAEHLGAFGQQGSVAQYHAAAGQFSGGQTQADVGADAGRFAGGDGQNGGGTGHRGYLKVVGKAGL